MNRMPEFLENEVGEGSDHAQEAHCDAKKQIMESHKRCAFLFFVFFLLLYMFRMLQDVSARMAATSV